MQMRIADNKDENASFILMMFYVYARLAQIQFNLVLVNQMTIDSISYMSENFLKKMLVPTFFQTLYLLIN